MEAPGRARSRGIAESRCTDAHALLVFLLFNYGLAVQAWRCSQRGDLRRLTRGIDFRGRLCGVNGSSARAGAEGELLYWCSRDGETRWDAPICVAACPTGGERFLCPLPHEGEELEERSGEEVLLTSVTRQRLVPEEAVPTRRVQNFCVPEDLGPQALLDQLLGAESGWPSRLLQAAGSLASLAAVPRLLSALLLAAVLSSVLWVLLVRASVRAFTWALLALSSLAFAGLGGTLLAGRGALSQQLDELQPGSKAALGALLTVVGLCVLPHFYYMNREKLGEAVKAVSDGCAIVLSMPLLALLPLLELLLRLGLLLAALAGAVVLLSAAEVRPSHAHIFGQVVAGVPRSFEVTLELVAGLLYVGFALVWYQELVSALSTFVISRTTVMAYFEPSWRAPSTLTAAVSHLGSLILGASTAACLLVPRRLGLARELSHRAYMDMAITASPLFDASRHSSSLLAGSALVLATRSILLQLVLQLGSLAFAAGCGLAAHALLAAAQRGSYDQGTVSLWAWQLLATADAGLPDAIAAELSTLGDPTAAAAAMGGTSYLLVQSFTTVIDRVADAVLYCSLWDKQSGATARRVPDRFRNVIAASAQTAASAPAPAPATPLYSWSPAARASHASSPSQASLACGAWAPGHGLVAAGAWDGWAQR